MPEYFLQSNTRAGADERFIGRTPNENGTHRLTVTREDRPKINQRFTHVDGGSNLTLVLQSPDLGGLEIPQPVEITPEGFGEAYLHPGQTLLVNLAEPVEAVSRRVLTSR